MWHLVFCFALISSLLPLLSSATKNPLQHRTIKIAAFEQPPDLFVTSNGTQISFHGPFYEIIEWMSLRLNFRYQFIIVENNLAVNLQSNAIQFMKKRSDIDILIPEVSVSLSRSLIIDLTYVNSAVPSAFLVPAVQPVEFIWTPVLTFPGTLWLLIGISCIVVTLYIWLLRDKNARFSDDLIFIFSILLSQGDIYRPRREAQFFFWRLVIALWGLMALIISYAYSGNLISNLTRPKEKEYPKGALELIEHFPGMFYVLLKGGIGEEMIMSASSGPVKKIGDSIRQHPEYLVSDIKSAYNYVASGCCAFAHLMPFARAEVYEDYKATGKCRFSLGNAYTGYGYVGIALQKSSSYTATVSLALLETIELGLFDHWMKPYADPPMPCLKKTKFVSRARTLQLVDLKFPFVLLGIGIGFSLLIFIFEIIRIKFTHKETSK